MDQWSYGWCLGTYQQEVPTGRSRDTGLGVGGAQGGLIFFWRYFFLGGCGTFWDILVIFCLILSHSKHNTDAGWSWKGLAG